MHGFIGVMRIYVKHAAILLATGALLQIAPADTSGQAEAQRAAPLRVEQDAPKRPRITGIDHVRLYASEIDKSREFYGTVLGLLASGGSRADINRPCFLVNAGPIQLVELKRAPGSPIKNWLAEIAFATDNVGQMRRYLLARGVLPGAPLKHSDGSRSFTLRDFEGNSISFIQRPPEEANYERSPGRISSRLIHAGFVVRDMAAENKFYVDLLGFRLYWYGGFKDDGVDWYEIQVPDGSDWIEYMLNIPANADHKELGVQNHFSVGVKDIHVAAEQLHKNGLLKFDGPEIGRDGKWGLDAYDPDGTRVEVMEFTPAGKPCCHPYTAAHPTP